MLRMKAKQEAPTPHVPRGLMRPYPGDESRRWATPEEFSAWMRGHLGTDIEFYHELANRWGKLREQTAKDLAELRSQYHRQDKGHMARLALAERAAHIAAAEHQYALGKIDAEEAA